MLSSVIRQGIPVPGPNMPPTIAQAATAAVQQPSGQGVIDTFSTASTGSATGQPPMPGGGVPAVGIPNSQDYPRLAFAAPYFGITTIDALADGPFLKLSGGTMTGNLSLPTSVVAAQGYALYPQYNVYAFRYPGPTNSDISGLAIGPGALAGQAADTPNHYNVAIGADAGQVGTALTNSTFVGVNAGQFANGDSGTAVGVGAMGVGVTTGQYNNAFGTTALAEVTSGHENVMIGSAAGQDITTGYGNVGVGISALNFFTTGYNNVGLGSSALEGVGSDTTGGTSTGYQNVAIGVSCAQLVTTGNDNTVIGSVGMHNISSGAFNIGLGSSVGPSLTTGSRNILIGYNCDVATAATNDSFVLGTGTTPLLTGNLASASLAMNVHGTLTASAYVSPPGSGFFWGSVATTSAQIFADANNMYFKLPVNAGGSFGFMTSNGTNHMLCDAGGNLSITGNFTVPSNMGLYLNGSVTGGPGRLYSDANNVVVQLAGSAGSFFVSNSGSTAVLYCDGSGDLTITGSTATKPGSTSWVNPSERALKQDIQPYNQGLQAVLALNPVCYRFREDSGFSVDEEHIGLVHDETSHMPEMHRRVKVGGSVDEPGREVDALDCSALTFALINSVKELATQNAALTERLSALEARL